MRPGLRIAVADDGVSPGGSLRARGEPIPNLSRLHLYSGATAAGIYERRFWSSAKTRPSWCDRALVLQQAPTTAP